MEKILIISNAIIILIAAIICIIFVIKDKKKQKQEFQQNQILKQQYQKISQACRKVKQDFEVNQKKNEQAKKSYYELESNIKISNNNLQNVKKIKQNYDKAINQEIEKLNNLKRQTNNYYLEEKSIVEKQLNDFKEVTSKAANIYVDNLEKVYEDAEARYKERIANLEAEQNSAAADLNKIKETRAAAYQALLKQREVKQNKDNYRLLPTAAQLSDIIKLQRIKLQLTKPRILSMLIWQSFFQPIAKEKFPIILQAKTKTGIYKITNLKTDECYIGQSLDIYKRWSDHCKAGLGIDTPVGNKLYKSIQQYGLQNFTFELICECPKQELNEKEKYFIELYQSDTYGYNSTAGNK